MLHNIQKIAGWVFFLLTIISCNRITATNTVSKPLSTSTLQVITPTSTIFHSPPIPSHIPTDLSKPTDKAVFTRTPLPTETLQPTTKVVPTSTIPFATQEAWKTVQALIPICVSGYGWQLSPNGQWIAAFSCTGDSENAPFYMKVLNIQDGREWRVDFDREKYGYNDGGLIPIHWTRDDRFLYVKVIQQMDGQGAGFVSASTLMRLNLETGELIEIFPNGFHLFEFSSNDKLAYRYGHRIRILDFAEWKEKEYPLQIQYCAIGNLLWSPLDDQLIFKTWVCKEGSYEEYSAYNLYMLDLKDGSVKELISSESELPYGIEWISQYPIYIDRYTDFDECFELNIDDGKWQPVECP